MSHCRVYGMEESKKGFFFVEKRSIVRSSLVP